MQTSPDTSGVKPLSKTTVTPMQHQASHATLPQGKQGDQGRQRPAVQRVMIYAPEVPATEEGKNIPSVYFAGALWEPGSASQTRCGGLGSAQRKVHG